MQKMIYLDHAATSPMPPAVLEAMQEYYREAWGNPGGIYAVGRKAASLLDDARMEFAGALGASPQEIYFTSGGTESDNWALTGICHAYPEKRHVITTAIEHHAILNTCRALEREGISVTYLPVEPDGTVCPDRVREAIRDDTALISIQMANNEIGTIEPISEIGEIARERGIWMHTDAVQAVGQLTIDLKSLPVDLLSVSGHKFGAPKGIGALFIRRGVHILPYMNGGEQERGLRAGTENVIGARLMAMALNLYREADFTRLSTMRDMFMDSVVARFPDIRINGSRTARLPANMHFSIPRINRNALLMQLDLAGIAASAGSACTAGVLEPSHVVQAIGGDTEAASLRLTLGHENTETEMDEVYAVLCRILERRRG